VCRRCIGGYEVEISIDGNKTFVDDFAKMELLKLLPRLDDLWNRSKEFCILELSKRNAPFQVSYGDFKLQSISVHKECSFDGGHLAFWFDLDCDNEGTYYVSFIEKRPSYLHRDT